MQLKLVSMQIDFGHKMNTVLILIYFIFYRYIFNLFTVIYRDQYEKMALNKETGQTVSLLVLLLHAETIKLSIILEGFIKLECGLFIT